jgi:glycosyltransferase involved in cell wall biosynthesis
MIGYSLSLKVISKLLKNRNLKKNYSYQPTVTVMVAAHNEEKVIKDKLDNIIRLNYPKNKIEFLVSSDNSTDKTNEIVKEFIKSHPIEKISLYEVKERKGKTNAQNEAQKMVKSEILVMTDANSIMDENAIIELVAAFADEDVSYVSGRLIIVNKEVSGISESENTYWDSDTKLRKIESDIYSITAGNGAIYACRNADYYDFDPIKCHDGNMPRYYVLNNKRALYNPDAIAYEKAGEVIEDEFKRKVRMNRGILYNILPDIRILNVIKYGWYSYFYFGHRTCRYLLWVSHLTVLVSNALLITESWFYIFTFLGQVLFYLLAFIKMITKTNNKLLTLIYYYTVTIIAQWVGVFNILTGKTKPFWEKAESTR